MYLDIYCVVFDLLPMVPATFHKSFFSSEFIFVHNKNTKVYGNVVNIHFTVFKIIKTFGKIFYNCVVKIMSVLRYRKHWIINSQITCTQVTDLNKTSKSRLSLNEIVF